MPVRKNSKRILNKNTRSLPNYKNGLIEIKIKQFKKLRNLLKKNKPLQFKSVEFIVSTNCPIVKKYCKKFRWLKVHERNKYLSSDSSIQELIELIPNICNGKFILWTHVTSPFFGEREYFQFLKKYFLAKKPTKSAFSADSIQKFLYNNRRGWISHNSKNNSWPRTQDLEKIYIANSAAFIASIKIYKKYKNRLCNSPIPITSNNEFAGFDVDEMKDLLYLKKRLKNDKI